MNKRQMKALRKAAREAGEASIYSAGEAARALYDMRRAGRPRMQPPATPKSSAPQQETTQ